MQTQECCTRFQRRLRAVAILKFGTVDALHRRLPLTARAIWAQIQRGRLSAPVETALKAALGDDAWGFVTGESSVLRDEGADHAAG